MAALSVKSLVCADAHPIVPAHPRSALEGLVVDIVSSDDTDLILAMSLGHETVGVVAAMGKNAKGFKIGDRVVAVSYWMISHNLFYQSTKS